MPVFQRQQQHCSHFVFFTPTAALLRGNRDNCAHFSASIDWLIGRLDQLESSAGQLDLNPFKLSIETWGSEDVQQFDCVLCCTGVLEVLQCALVQSSEVINVFKEGHIQSIISFLDKHGRNHKVDVSTVWVLGSLLGTITGGWCRLFTDAETILAILEKSPLIN